MTQDKKTGTREWSKKSINLFYGCSNNCSYCYAKGMWVRFRRNKGLPPKKWECMEPNYIQIANTQKKIKNDYNKTGLYDYMAFTAHDITLDEVVFNKQKIDQLYNDKKISKIGYQKLIYMYNKQELSGHIYTVAELCGLKLRELLRVGNTVLVVSKPNIKALNILYDTALAHRDHISIDSYKKNIEFRFTIGSKNDKTLKKWEPNAPPFWYSRFNSLVLYSLIYKVSVSLEPFFDENPLELIKFLEQSTKGNIKNYWLGCFSNMSYEHHSKENLLKIVKELKELPKQLQDKVFLKNSLRDRL